MVKIAIVDDDKTILDQVKELLVFKIGNDFKIDCFSDSVLFNSINENWDYDIFFLILQRVRDKLRAYLEKEGVGV